MSSRPPSIRRWHPLAEIVRVALLVAAAAAITRLYFTGRFVGGTDARWYAYMLQDFLAQVHAGRFPVLVGQGLFAWNGGVHPFRSAPMYFYVAGFWDLVTFHSLGVLALQHLTVITSAVAGALGFYAAGAALLPGRRWEAMLVALLYVGAPAWLAIIYGSEAYMTFMALGALPLMLYGNARSLLSPEGRGYPQLAAGLALVWMCHPPVAMLSTLATVFLQGGIFLAAPPCGARGRAAVRGAFLFAGLGAFYFVAMSDLPPRSGSPLLRDALQLGGLGLALLGLARGVLQKRGVLWLACWVPAAFLLGWSCAPWLWWMAATAALAAVAAPAARRLFGFDSGRRTLDILLPCLFAAAGFAQAWLGPERPERNLESLAGLWDNAAHAVDFFLPMSGPLNQHNNFQPGAGLWILLLVVGAAFFRTRSLAVKLFFVAGLLPVFALVRVPWVSDFLIGYFPDAIAGIVNFPLVLRLVPVMTALIAMGFVVWLVDEGPGCPFGRTGPLLFLTAAVAWCGVEAWRFTDRGWRLVATPEASRDILRPENVFLAHFDYDLLPIPSYFWEGVVDPRLEFRLLDSLRRPYTGPDDCARRMEASGATTLRLVARNDVTEGPEWLEFEPRLTLAPGEHVLLRFAFDPARDYTGWLIFQSEHGYRQYHLPNVGLAKGFGVAPERSHVISLWNSGSAPEHYRLRMSREAGNDLGRGQPFATVAISRYDDARNPVRVNSFDPLRATVDAERPGWFETTRVFLPGYAATVDGRETPVVPSPEKLAMVAIPAGRHAVELRYRGTPVVWVAAAVSALSWAGWLGGFFRPKGRTRKSDAGPKPEAGMRDPQDAAAVGRLRTTLARASLVLAIGAVALFYGWTVWTSGASFSAGNVRNQYYSQLTAGFRAGHLYMDAPVDPALLALPENRRPGNAPYLLDASLYHDRYYMYFGVAPVAVLFWPYAALTGRPLPEAAAALVFAIAGFGFATAWWLGMRRRRFPRLGGRWTVLGVLAIGLCSAAPSTLRRPLFYEVAICSGYAFTMLALWAVTEARFRPDRRLRWLALAGVAAGMAVGSRANLAPAGLALLVIGSAAAARALAPAMRRHALWACLAAALIGFGGVGTGLAAYNYARFGDVFEFGHKYQLGLNPRHMFQAANLWHNLEIYYFTPPALNGYFPFVAPALAPPPPSDYIGREHVHGEWIWLPLAAMAAAVAVAAWRRRRADWMWTLAPPLVLFGVNFLITGAAGSRANRYMLDFHPELILVTLLALAPALTGRGAWPALVRYLTGVGIAAAVLFNALASIQVHGFFALVEPAAFSRLANAANRLVWPWMRGEAAAVGDREVEVRWPRTEAGLGSVWQPILATGTPGFDDILWIKYDGGARAQLIFEHGEYGSAFGEWFPLPVGGTSRLRISGAFLLPGTGHPWYGDRPADEQAVLKRHLRVTIDGQVRFDRDVPSYDSSPRLQRWGSWRAADTALVYRFSGGLGEPVVDSLDDGPAREAIAARGAIRLRLALPADRYGSTEPILQSGAPDAFDTLAVKYVDRTSIRLIHDSLGAGADESDLIPVDYRQFQYVEVEAPFAADGLGWSESEPVPSRVPPARLRVRWNGRDAFESKLPPHPASAASIAVGGSLMHSSQSRLIYAGLLVASPRQEPLGPVGPGRLECRLPSLDSLADDRGVLIRFERADGESAILVWRHGGDGLQLGWVDSEVTQWSAPLSSTETHPVISLAISGPHAAEGVVLASPDVVKYEAIDIRLGTELLLSTSTDIFSAGRVRASGILPDSWSGSARSQSGIGGGAIVAAVPRLPGRIRIRFRLPPPFGGGQPLVEAGRPVAADSIYLRRTSDGRYVIGLDHWLTSATESQPLALAAGEPHTLIVEMGSLFTAPAVPRDRVRLILDGHVILQANIVLYPVRPGEVFIARNPLAMSTSDPEFRGELISVRTLQPPPAVR